MALLSMQQLPNPTPLRAIQAVSHWPCYCSPHRIHSLNNWALWRIQKPVLFLVLKRQLQPGNLFLLNQAGKHKESYRLPSLSSKVSPKWAAVNLKFIENKYHFGYYCFCYFNISTVSVSWLILSKVMADFNFGIVLLSLPSIVLTRWSICDSVLCWPHLRVNHVLYCYFF